MDALILKKLRDIRKDMLQAAPQIDEPCIDIAMSVVCPYVDDKGKHCHAITVAGLIDLVEHLLKVGVAVRRH